MQKFSEKSRFFCFILQQAKLAITHTSHVYPIARGSRGIRRKVAIKLSSTSLQSVGWGGTRPRGDKEFAVQVCSAPPFRQPAQSRTELARAPAAARPAGVGRAS